MAFHSFGTPVTYVYPSAPLPVNVSQGFNINTDVWQALFGVPSAAPVPVPVLAPAQAPAEQKPAEKPAEKPVEKPEEKPAPAPDASLELLKNILEAKKGSAPGEPLNFADVLDFVDWIREKRRRNNIAKLL